MFDLDWTDKQAVIQWLKRKGWKGHTVFKDPSRDNYNITHTSRTDRYKEDWVVYQQ